MAALENHLQRIAHQLNIDDNEREKLVDDFDVIRSFMMNDMSRIDKVFNWVCMGESRYGKFCKMFMVYSNKCNNF